MRWYHVVGIVVLTHVVAGGLYLGFALLTMPNGKEES